MIKLQLTVTRTPKDFKRQILLEKFLIHLKIENSEVSGPYKDFTFFDDTQEINNPNKRVKIMIDPPPTRWAKESIVRVCTMSKRGEKFGQWGRRCIPWPVAIAPFYKTKHFKAIVEYSFQWHGKRSFQICRWDQTARK